MKKLLATMAISAAMATGANAASVNLDFVALAAGTPGDRGGVEGQTFNFGGLGVTLTSSHNAYLDDLSGGKPAGLGVCKALDGSNQCTPSSDDNVTETESVTLTFSQGLNSLTDFVFYDADHNAIDTTATLLWDIVDDLGAVSNFSTFGGLEGGIAGSQVGLIYSLTLGFDNGFNSASEFYLGSVTADYTPVPLPASILLLGGAMGGLGLMRRRRKAA